MARPTKNGGNEKRDLIVHVRFTAGEKRKIETQAKASGIKYLSDYLRKRIFDTGAALSGQFFPERETLIRWLAELGKVGSNLNQIARVLNARELRGDRSEIPAERIQETIDRVDKLVEYLLGIIGKYGSKGKTAR